MPLFWIKSEVDGRAVFHLCEDGAQIFAMIRWRIAANGGEYRESGEIDPAVVDRVPKRMIGRDLAQDEMLALLGRLERAVRSPARAPRSPSRRRRGTARARS